MTYEQVTLAIKQVLEESMKSPCLDAFHEHARLNEDLYLDSVLVLQLMLHLELDLGVKVPDENLSKKDYETVASLASFIVGLANESEVSVDETSMESEEFEDVKVHCFVSCVCESLKRAGIDHRPFYFGVWDAEFTVTDNYHLRYHSDDVDHRVFRDWYKRLYGGDLIAWYEGSKSKNDNIETMMTLLAGKPNSMPLMVMLDMYQLPERENKFSQNPFPHYVLLQQGSRPNTFMMSDPDFRWEGEIDSDRVINAIAQPTVAGGYYFDAKVLHSANDEDIKAYFELCFTSKNRPLNDAIKSILIYYVQGEGVSSLGELSQALREIKVIAVRKYAYEHGFAFFWRALGLPDDEFEHWCDVVEELVQTYSNVQYQVMKLAQTENTELVKGIYTLLEKQEKTENKIRARLYEAYMDWCEFTFSTVC
ncbi:DUF6005 family protein [Photobacterium makurazakiensis]|uniref:DUF6005 family protein n=1 Tax=Photobacterium makurazakiensis TaxID=2910234 RepID=UPI003D1120D5